MANPATRDEFKAYCLRKLGDGVVQINVSDEQVEDRIDESLSYYADYHFDATEKTYLKHQVTANDISNGYLTIPENIIGVVDIFDIGDSQSTTNLFNARYQFALNYVFDLSSYGLQTYYIYMQNIQFLEEFLVGKQPIRYQRHVNKLHIDMDWNNLTVGQYIIAVCYRIVDPDVYTDVWKDRWLQNYCSAKIKYQWGSNLTKFVDMQLPGGVRYNGELILNEARDEINKLEEEMISSYSLPVTDFIG